MSVPGGGRYLSRLAARARQVGSCLCLGLDPDPHRLPDGFTADLAGIERFARLVVEAAAPRAAAIKPNLAYWEAWGSQGLAALERVRAALPADLPVILDAKRGDIGATSGKHAVALFDALGADAVTASPYLGEEAIAPLLERRDGFVYVLCRTSNPGAGELQGLLVESDLPGGSDAARGSDGRIPLYRAVARRVRGWGPGGTVGLVVGATAADELAAVREDAPELPFLVPGVGAQGGDLASTLRSGPARQGPAAELPGGALVVNVSRAIAEAALGAADPHAALAAASREWAARVPVLR